MEDDNKYYLWMMYHFCPIMRDQSLECLVVTDNEKWKKEDWRNWFLQQRGHSEPRHLQSDVQTQTPAGLLSFDLRMQMKREQLWNVIRSMCRQEITVFTLICWTRFHISNLCWTRSFFLYIFIAFNNKGKHIHWKHVKTVFDGFPYLIP